MLDLEHDSYEYLARIVLTSGILARITLTWQNLAGSQFLANLAKIFLLLLAETFDETSWFCLPRLFPKFLIRLQLSTDYCAFNNSEIMLKARVCSIIFRKNCWPLQSLVFFRRNLFLLRTDPFGWNSHFVSLFLWEILQNTKRYSYEVFRYIETKFSTKFVISPVVPLKIFGCQSILKLRRCPQPSTIFPALWDKKR